MSFDGWETLPLSDIIELVIDYRGKTPKKLGGDWTNSGYRALSAKNIKTGKIVQEDTIRFVDENIYRKWMKDEIKRGDIIITSEAPFGEVYYWGTDEKILLSQRLFGLRINNNYYSKYIYYFMTSNSFQGELYNRATGTTVIGLRQPELLKCSVDIPPFLEQKAIADTLSCLDDKIELNNRINKTLEAMLQAIFKSWFVDFEPFQDGEFEDSELGKIPKGWKVGTLGDILNLNYGKALPAKYRIHGEIKVYSSAGVTGFHNQSLIDEPSIIVGRKGTIGTVYYSTEPSFCIDTAYYASQEDSKIPLLLMYQLLKELNLSQYNEDSAVPGLNRNTVYSIKTVIPPQTILLQCSEILTSIYNLIFYNINQSQTLTAVRDALLPKLMSGEIRVPLEEVQ